MKGPAPVLPRHVRACWHSREHLERWFIWTWNRSSAHKQTRVPYKCNSWRCPVCRRYEASVAFARMKEAMTRPELDPRGWVFLVLTIDRNGYFSGKPWRDVNEAYRALGAMNRAVLERIGREWGPETRVITTRSKKTGKIRVRHVPTVGNRWVAVVEAHRSGWPHVNLMVWCPDLAAELRHDEAQRLEDPEIADAVELARDAWSRKEPVPEWVRERARRATVIGGRLAELVTDAGWGLQSTAEAARNLEAVAGYAVKLAGLQESSMGELAKITQVPMAAPERFRRIRSGKGFLPPRRSNPEITGCMILRRRARDVKGRDLDAWEIAAINAPKDQHDAVECARSAELQLIDEEERLKSRARGKLCALPPIRLAVAGKLESHKQTSERRSALRARDLSACA